MSLSRIFFTAIVFALSGAFARIIFEEYKRSKRK